MKPGDLAAVALVMVLAFYWPVAPEPTGSLQAIISLNGRVVRRLSLGSAYQMVRIAVPGGTATFQLRRGRIRLLPLPVRLSPTEQSSRQGFIGRPGESLICLPLRLAVTIRGGSQPDAVLP